MLLATLAQAQTPPAATVSAAPAADLNSVTTLAWLDGCWAGSVNQRDFREQWSPLRGGVLLGVGSTVFQNKLQSYEFLRIEVRGEGVYYVAAESGQSEVAFKLTSITTDDKDTIFTFTNPGNEFPQRIVYRRATEGWLYATIDGKLRGEDRQVIYPMRRIGCESGEKILR
ncbi:MAG: hypothetical protein IT521_14310 [Burkholderiales bacterium]|nr:hypothetical protein [Burkholderiales bacterium]